MLRVNARAVEKRAFSNVTDPIVFMLFSFFLYLFSHLPSPEVQNVLSSKHRRITLCVYHDTFVGVYQKIFDFRCTWPFHSSTTSVCKWAPVWLADIGDFRPSGVRGGDVTISSPCSMLVSFEAVKMSTYCKLLNTEIYRNVACEISKCVSVTLDIWLER